MQPAHSDTKPVAKGRGPMARSSVPRLPRTVCALGQVLGCCCCQDTQGKAEPSISSRRVLCTPVFTVSARSKHSRGEGAKMPQNPKWSDLTNWLDFDCSIPKGGNRRRNRNQFTLSDDFSQLLKTLPKHFFVLVFSHFSSILIPAVVSVALLLIH